MSPADQSSIDAFIDALWLEEGLSKNPLAAYRRDLSLYARWLAGRGRPLDATGEADINGYFAGRQQPDPHRRRGVQPARLQRAGHERHARQHVAAGFLGHFP
jgi:site-specific recombinase XerD